MAIYIHAGKTDTEILSLSPETDTATLVDLPLLEMLKWNALARTVLSINRGGMESLLKAISGTFSREKCSTVRKYPFRQAVKVYSAPPKILGLQGDIVQEGFHSEIDPLLRSLRISETSVHKPGHHELAGLMNPFSKVMSPNVIVEYAGERVLHDRLPDRASTIPCSILSHLRRSLWNLCEVQVPGCHRALRV